MKPISFKDLIVLENDDYILINKPPYLPTLDERTKQGDNILRLAKKYWDDAQVCHRLDKETSGMLAIAKHPDAYRKLSMQFEDRVVDKTYHAVTNGVHNFEGVCVYLPLRALPTGTSVIDRVEGKEAETIFDTLEVFQTTTLVACKPITGRMHQIRVHLTCVKAPIVADKQYGGSDIFLSDLKRKFNLKQGTEEQPLINRVALHAFSLEFEGMDGSTIRAEAPYPKDIKALLTQLRKT